MPVEPIVEIGYKVKSYDLSGDNIGAIDMKIEGLFIGIGFKF